MHHNDPGQKVSDNVNTEIAEFSKVFRLTKTNQLEFDNANCIQEIVKLKQKLNEFKSLKDLNLLKSLFNIEKLMFFT